MRGHCACHITHSGKIYPMTQQKGADMAIYAAQLLMEGPEGRSAGVMSVMNSDRSRIMQCRNVIMEQEDTSCPWTEAEEFRKHGILDGDSRRKKSWSFFSALPHPLDEQVFLPRNSVIQD